MSIALITYVAKAVPFDNTGTDFDALNVQDGMTELDFRRLVKYPSGFEDRTQVSISFNNATRTITIAPTGSAFYYRILGKRFEVTSPAQLQIPNTAGSWYFSFTNTGALVADQNFHDFGDITKIPVSVAIWSTTDQQAIYLGDQRHEVHMPWIVKKRLQKADGPGVGVTDFVAGDYLLNEDGSSNTHITFSLTGGLMYEADLDHTVVHSASPSLKGEQTLNGIAKIPMYYKSGPTGEWRRLDPTDYALALNPGSTPYWNEWTGSTWQLSPMPSKSYGATFLVITPNLQPGYAVIGIVPQFIANNLIDATVDIYKMSDFSGVPITEVYPLVLAVYEANSSFTNTPKARYVAFVGTEGLESQIDRYAVLGSYGGAANVGRYLEVVPGEDMSTAPFYFPEDSYIRTITLQFAAVATVTLGFFESTNLTTPLFTLSVTGQDKAVFDVSQLFTATQRLAIRITAGTCQKPKCRFWIQTSVGG